MRGQSHLSTYELFHGPESWMLNMSSPLVQACYIGHVRFEIFQSLLNTREHTSTRIDYSVDLLPALAHPADDVAWGNRIAWLAARCLQWADSDARTLGEWQNLTEIVDEWERERPSSFNAFYYRDANMLAGRNFPDLWFSSMPHGKLMLLASCARADVLLVNAFQHLRIARITLAVNHPSCGLGSRKGFAEAGEVEVTKPLREMVAAVRCNTHAMVPTAAIAAHTIHKFGGCLQNFVDQSDIIEFLEEVEIVGWKTDVTKRWLKVQWNWPLQDDSPNLGNEDFL